MCESGYVWSNFIVALLRGKFKLTDPASRHYHGDTGTVFSVTMRHYLFIINPNAGSRTVEEFEAALRLELEKLPPSDETVYIEHMIPETPELLRETLREKLRREPIDAVGIVGGDGTIMEALPAMVEFPHVPMALIPYGTGNLLAVNLGIPRDFSGALNAMFTGRPRRIDVGKIDNHYFALLSGVGTVAEIMENTSSERKKKLGIWAYFVDGVRTIMRTRGSRLKVTTGEGRIFKTHGVSIVISNAASFMGPCPPLTPEAEPDDGLLDVCIIKARSKRDYIPAVLQLMQHPEKNTNDRNINYFQTRKVRIEANPVLKVQADGNIIGTTPVDVEIVRNRLQVIIPATQAELPPEHLRAENESTLRSLLAGAIRHS